MNQKVLSIPDLIPRLAYHQHGDYKGGWKRWEIQALGGTWPPVKGWKASAIARLPKPLYDEVMRLRLIDNDERAKRKQERKRKRKAAKRGNTPLRNVAAPQKTKKAFYQSWEWKKARFETIKRYGPVCMCCGAEENIVVDHIKPRTKYPRLEMDLDNLQVLCNDCNMGKSNDDETDFRPKNNELSRAELDELERAVEADRHLH